MRKVFYDWNTALDYAQSIGIDTAYFCRDAQWNARALTNLGLTIGFDIDGFSSVEHLIYVDEYDVERHGEVEHYKEIRHRGFVLHLLESDKRYYISNRDKTKYGLTSLELLDASYNSFSFFRTELEAPQNIGKATRTKILNWADYSDAIEREKISYWQARKDRRERTIANIRKSCPVLRVWETGKAYNKYDFEGLKMQYISDDGLTITWEFDGCGSIGRSYGYDYTKADKLANSLDGLK